MYSLTSLLRLWKKSRAQPLLIRTIQNDERCVGKQWLALSISLKCYRLHTSPTLSSVREPRQMLFQNAIFHHSIRRSESIKDHARSRRHFHDNNKKLSDNGKRARMAGRREIRREENGMSGRSQAQTKESQAFRERSKVLLVRAHYPLSRWANYLFFLLPLKWGRF